jgi:hypothetical protein
MTIDLSDFDSLISAQEEEVENEIKHPQTREPIGLAIRAAGPDSERTRSAQRKFLHRRLGKRRAGQVTAEELEAEGLQSLAAAIIG